MLIFRDRVIGKRLGISVGVFALCRICSQRARLHLDVGNASGVLARYVRHIDVPAAVDGGASRVGGAAPAGDGRVNARMHGLDLIVTTAAAERRRQRTKHVGTFAGRATI